MRLLGTIVLAASALFAQDQPLVHVNTRLVEVDVVVRNSHGPVAGLTKQDFTILDKGKPQEIAVFSVKSARGGAAAAPVPAAVPPGVAANRIAVANDAPTGATVVLVDRLNTAFEFQPYMDQQLLQLLGSMKAGSPIALYTLGRDLNPVYDFTEDPARLLRVAASLADKTIPLQPGDERTAKKVKTALEETLNLEQVDRPQVTFEALKRISQHLNAVHGRKGLVWLSGSFPLRNSRVLRGTPDAERIEDTSEAMNDSNMAIYPVDVKGLSAAVRFSRRAVTIAPFGADVMNELAKETGGQAFYNSNDISGAVQNAIQDAEATYTLGFYPNGDALDGKFHPIQVKVAKEELTRGADVRYREGYVASEATPPDKTRRRAQGAKLSLDDILDDPLDANAVGIAAVAAPVANKPGTIEVKVQVDVADLLLQMAGGKWTGAMDLAVRWTDSKKAVQKVHRFAINATEPQLRALLASGFLRQELLEIGTAAASEDGEIQVAVQDHETGAAGSVRVPLTRQ